MTSPTRAQQGGSAPIVSLRDAAFGYADRAVVTGVSVDIHAGEVVAILGPNGSGKSTLVKGILGLNDHIGGQVELFGMPFDRFRDHARLGYVPQRHTLSTSVRATSAEIVAIGRLPHQSWLGRMNHEDRRIVEESLTLVGLADRANVDVSTLSGGQQRRVLIARALAAQPDVLIMDEPTAGVDLASQEVLSQVLGRLAARGATMMIVTHELRALRDVLSRIIEIDGGQILFDGTSSEHDRWHDALAARHDGHDHDGHHDNDWTPRGSTAAGPLDHVAGGHNA